MSRWYGNGHWQRCPGGQDIENLNRLIRRLDRIDAQDNAAASQVNWTVDRARMAAWRNALQARQRGEISPEDFLRYNERFDATRPERPPETPEQRKRADGLVDELLGMLDQSAERLRREHDGPLD